MHKRSRQYIGLLAAVIAYYLVHEGAHLLYAAAIGAFRGIRFMGIGVQIEVFSDAMTATQLALFCLAGPAAALLAAWGLSFSAERICRCPSSLAKACAYYATLALLLIDPLYLSLLCGFVGGGDMNGIALLLPQPLARAAFALVLLLNGVIFLRTILPTYRAAFSAQH